MKLITAFTALALASSAWALDPKQCPESFTLELSGASVYKSSAYSETPGWKEAQKSLKESLTNAALDGASKFELVARKKDSCFYQDNQGATANLKTFQLQDPEEVEPYFSEYLSVQFQIEKSNFNLFIDVSEFSPTSLILPSDASKRRTRIRVRLMNPQNHKFYNHDIGLVRVGTEVEAE
jgi:hypothetical protein